VYEVRHAKEIRSGVRVQDGDFLLAKITPCFENGKQGIVRGLPGGWGYATTEVFPLRALPGLLPEFLALYLLLPDVRNSLAAKMQGATGRQRLPRDALDALPLPLPPLWEQRAIADVLGTVQGAIEATERVIAAARELKRSLMRHLFTYGPVPLAEAERVRLKETEIGPLPEHWQTHRLGGVTEAMQYGLSQRGKAWGAYAILRMNNLSGGQVRASDLQYVDLDHTSFLKFRLRSGDILFNRTNSYELVGKTALFDLPGDYVFASYLIRVVVDRSRMYPPFLSYYMNMEGTQGRLKSLSTRGVSQSNISATKLRSFAVPLPSLSEQERIADALRVVDAKIAAEDKRRAALEALFRSLLRELMTGRVRVTPHRPPNVGG